MIRSPFFDVTEWGKLCSCASSERQWPAIPFDRECLHFRFYFSLFLLCLNQSCFLLSCFFFFAELCRDHYFCNINETIIRLQANAMVSLGLSKVGYNYVV
jgi:hypothetical protein